MSLFGTDPVVLSAIHANTAALNALLRSQVLTLGALSTLIKDDRKMSKELDDVNTALGGMAKAVADNGAAIAQLAQAQIDAKDDPAKVEAIATQIQALSAQMGASTQAALDAAGKLTAATPTATVPAPTTPAPDADAALAAVQPSGDQA